MRTTPCVPSPSRPPLPSDPGERGRLALHTLIARYLQKDSLTR